MTQKKLLIAIAIVVGITQPVVAQDRVNWWYEQATPDQQQLITKNIVEPFEKAYPDQRLIIDYRGSELDKQLRIAMLSGNGPDIVYTAGPSYVAPMALSGQLMVLDDYAAKYQWQDRILSVFLKMGEYNGKLYTVPKTYETLGLFYNKTLFEKRGWQPPNTLDEMEKLADAMLQEGITPFAAGNANWRATNEWFVTLAFNAVAGPDNLNKALRGEIPWTAEPFSHSIERLNSWWQKGYFGKHYFSIANSEQTADMMASGKAGMMPSGTWQFQNAFVYGKAHDSQVGFVSFPSISGDPIFPLGIGSTFSIAAKTKNPDGAAKAIDFLLSPQVYSTMNSAWQGEWNIPLKDMSRIKMSSEVAPLFVETMKELSGSVADNKYGYTTWTFLPPETNSYVINGIEEVWLDKISTNSYLSKLNETFQNEFKAGKAPTVPAR